MWFNPAVIRFASRHFKVVYLLMVQALPRRSTKRTSNTQRGTRDYRTTMFDDGVYANRGTPMVLAKRSALHSLPQHLSQVFAKLDRFGVGHHVWTFSLIQSINSSIALISESLLVSL